MATKKKITTAPRTRKKAVRKGQDKKSIVIAALFATILLMSVGYAAFATTLTINGNATISGSWNVEITDITAAFTGTATDKTAPAYTATTATFDADLQAPGDKATYTITVKNKGTITASLSSIVLTPDNTTGSSAIIYAVESQPAAGDTLAPNATTTVVISATYDSTVTAVPDNKTKAFTGTLIYQQAN